MKHLLISLILLCASEFAIADFEDFVCDSTITPTSPTTQDSITVSIQFCGRDIGSLSWYSIEGGVFKLRLDMVYNIIPLLPPPPPIPFEIGRLPAGSNELIIELEFPNGEIVSGTRVISVAPPTDAIPAGSPISYMVLIVLFGAIAKRHITRRLRRTRQAAPLNSNVS